MDIAFIAENKLSALLGLKKPSAACICQVITVFVEKIDFLSVWTFYRAFKRYKVILAELWRRRQVKALAEQCTSKNRPRVTVLQSGVYRYC